MLRATWCSRESKLAICKSHFSMEHRELRVPRIQGPSRLEGSESQPHPGALPRRFLTIFRRFTDRLGGSRCRHLELFFTGPDLRPEPPHFVYYVFKRMISTGPPSCKQLEHCSRHGIQQS